MNLAAIGLLTYGIHAVWLVLALVVLIVLIRLYIQTRMSGFLWLLFAVVVWPFLSRGASLALPMYVAQQGLAAGSLMAVTLEVAAVETIVGGVLLLVAVLVLQRQVAEQMLIVRPAIPGASTVSGLPPYRS